MQVPDNTILDVILSLVLIFALLSVLVSLINETWAHYFNNRGSFLKKTIAELINDKQNLNYAELLFNHDIINRLIKTNESKLYGLTNFKRTNLPGHITANQFADAFIDIMLQQARRNTPIIINTNADGAIQLSPQTAAVPQNLANLFHLSLETMNGSKMKDMLSSFHLKSLGGTSLSDATTPADYYDKLKKLIGEWFDEYMNQSSGEYKVKQRPRLTIIGLVVAMGLNVDSLHLAKKIFNEPELRESLVNNAMLFGDALAHQSDSVRYSISGQLAAVKEYHQKVDSSLKVMVKKSVGDSAAVDSTRKVIINGLQKDSTALAKAIRSMINQLDIADTLKNSYSMALHTEIARLPIGYRKDEAPLSWFGGGGGSEDCGADHHHRGKHHNESEKKADLKKQVDQPASQVERNNAKVMQYYANRNAGKGNAVFMYILGIIITSLSLSLGAPFWFEALMKLVNLRRGAVKPKA
jgi:hypothetical protein